MHQKTFVRGSVLAAWLAGQLVFTHAVSAAKEGTLPPDHPQISPGTPAPPTNTVPVLPDEQAPLTPQIRPHGPTERLPDLPEKKAEPKGGPKGEPKTTPQMKEALPSPKGTPAPHAKPAKPSSTAKAQPFKPGLAVVKPRTPAERDKALSDLYAYLAAAEDTKQAETISASIERLWVTPGSDTISLLMQRAMHAVNSKNTDLALKLLDAVVSLAPDYAEGWNRRAYVHYTRNEVDLALGDLRRTLALDPNHFKALDGLVHILNDIGRKKEALMAARKLLDVDPYYAGAQQIIDELAREIEGRGI